MSAPKLVAKIRKLQAISVKSEAIRKVIPSNRYHARVPRNINSRKVGHSFAKALKQIKKKEKNT